MTSADAFIFDTGSHIFAWVGKSASVNERSRSLKYAQVSSCSSKFALLTYFVQDYITQYNRPPFTPLTRILDGGENAEFENSFDR